MQTAPRKRGKRINGKYVWDKSVHLNLREAISTRAVRIYVNRYAGRYPWLQFRLLGCLHHDRFAYFDPDYDYGDYSANYGE